MFFPRHRNTLLSLVALLAISAPSVQAAATKTPIVSTYISPLLLDNNWSVPAAETVRFAVVSDPHVYDRSLGIGGTAWETYLAGDRKLLAESEALLKAAVDDIKQEAPHFLFVTGDLTKDGEKASHELVARYLAEVEDAGIEVFVIPGNHDVANPHAHGYQGASTVAVPTVSAGEFAAIYGDFGYKQAFSRHPESLSYAVRVNDKLWLLALDSCRYQENTTSPVTGGRLSESTLTWLEGIMNEANRQGARVIAYAHHGIMEHYNGQSVDGIGNEYVIEHFGIVGNRLARAGLRAVFTGHFHAQDVAGRNFTLADNTVARLIDIETGSLVTYPSPYRYASIAPDGTFTLSTKTVDTIDPTLAPASGWNPASETFAAYSETFLLDGLKTLATGMLQLQFGVDASTAAALAPYIADAFKAHYAGNEQASPATQGFIAYLESQSDTASQTLAAMLTNMWTDPGEDDLTRNGPFDPVVNTAP